MAFELDDAVPWGRNFDEYVRMFALSDEELDLPILSCADGPACFNSVVHARGGRVISCDPIYRFSAEQIRRRIEATGEDVIRQARLNAAHFVWDTIESPQHLACVRMKAMEQFLADFESGKREGRYLAESLPLLPFDDLRFDLAVCSHFSFLYTKQLSLRFHIDSVAEMCRVAREVRIFPLVDLEMNVSGHLLAVRERLQQTDFDADLVRVPYEFQRGANQMLRIRRR